MEQARNVLKNTAQHVDITIARSPTPVAPQPCGGEIGNCDASGGGGVRIKSTGPKPLARRKRRLPVIERPKSAPLAGELTGFLALGGGRVGGGVHLEEQQDMCEEVEESNSVLDVCDFSQAVSL